MSQFNVVYMYNYSIISPLYFVISLIQFPDECSCPPIPANGFISGCNVTGVVGDTIEYSCRSGYYLVGASTRTCQTGGNWTARASICQKGIGLFVEDFLT